jgi:protein MON2
LNKISQENHLRLGELDSQSFNDLQNSDNFAPTIWFYLLKRLTDLISDPRHEVRNGTIHTILRIFDTHGDDFSSTVWQFCLSELLLVMLRIDLSGYEKFAQERVAISDLEIVSTIKNNIGTSQVLLQGLSKLVADYLDPICHATEFASLWESLTKCLNSYLDQNLHDITAAVYLAVDVILSRASKVFGPDSTAVESIFSMWLSRVPSWTSKLDSDSNIESFEAYTTALTSVYGFKREAITKEETVKIVNNLERCIRDSHSPTYTSDLDSLTALQSRVIQCLSMLRIDLDGTTSLVLELLGRFMSLPFEAADSQTKPGLTFVALSKASMDVVRKITHSEAAWNDIFSSECLQLILSNLERTIKLKYVWQRQGRSPPLWKKAVIASVDVLGDAIPPMSDHKLNAESVERYWKSIIGIYHNIAHANLDPDHKITDSTIYEDEQFDIESLQKLNSLIIPALGSSDIPDSIRQTHARSLLTASIVHEPEAEELRDLETEPVGALYDLRFGRTYDPEPSSRSKIAFFCFDTLLSLLKLSNSSPVQIKLAEAAAPYVILRAGLPLKAYVADQPLRGKLPIPQSQVYELVTILRELRDVRCEPSAIPPTEKGFGKEGGHLVRLYPLVVAAAKIDNGPDEIKEELGRWLETMGKELGVPLVQRTRVLV